jgi:hypothetical protein
MPMNLLPCNTTDVAKSESGYPRENSCGDHDSKEIPEPANERSARKLFAEQAPREWRDTVETDEKPDIGRKVLYRGPSQVIELRENLNPAWNTP